MRYFKTLQILFSVLSILLPIGVHAAETIDYITKYPKSNIKQMVQVPKHTSFADSESNWWNEAVFYEIFVRSFADASAGPLAGDGIGDLVGLTEKLDYLNDGNPYTYTDLGVTAIWLMPIMEAKSYHGYDTKDYYLIEQDYGTNEDFARFMEEAHKRGIRVILDLVVNHASREHPMFERAINDEKFAMDWFLWRDTESEFKGPWDQTIWHYMTDTSYYYGLFWDGMPDWNFRNPNVVAEMNNVVKYWLTQYDVDGYRLDAIRYLFESDTQIQDLPETHEWLRNYQKLHKSVKADSYSVGEVWAGYEDIKTYGTDELDSTFQFDYAQTILKTVNSGKDYTLYKQQKMLWEDYQANTFATFLTNHDKNRVMSEFNQDEDKAKLAAGILLTGPGIPYMYYGEEIGMTGTKPDEFIRTPMQWTNNKYADFSTAEPWIDVNNDYEWMNVEDQQFDEVSIWATYRRLIMLKSRHPALKNGGFVHVPTNTSKVNAYFRTAEDETLLVVHNVSPDPIADYKLGIEDDRHYLVPLFSTYNDVLPKRLDDLTQPIPGLRKQNTYVFKLIARKSG